ncbi:hypothetical protein GW17_00042117 [Ensete ventricosum]|nr:hypothetical protein GW17_00042117 [Ensete ventricosum]
MSCRQRRSSRSGGRWPPRRLLVESAATTLTVAVAEEEEEESGRERPLPHAFTCRFCPRHMTTLSFDSKENRRSNFMPVLAVIGFEIPPKEVSLSTDLGDLFEKVNSGADLGDLAEKVNSGTYLGDMTEKITRTQILEIWPRG